MSYIELKNAITQSTAKKITDGINISVAYTDSATNTTTLAHITYADFNEAVADIVNSHTPPQTASYATPYTEPYIYSNTNAACPVIAISVDGATENDNLVAYNNNSRVSSGSLRNNTFYNVVDYESFNLSAGIIIGVKIKGTVASLAPHHVITDYIFTTDDNTKNINYNFTHIDLSDSVINVSHIDNGANFRNVPISTLFNINLIELNTTFFYEDRGMYSGITYLSMPKKFYTIDASSNPYETSFVSNFSLTPYTKRSNCFLHSSMFATYVDTIDLSNLDFKYAEENSVTYLFDTEASNYSTHNTCYVNNFKLPRNIVTYWSGIFDKSDNRVGYLNLIPYYINDNDSLYEIANLSFNHADAHKNYCYIYVNSITLERLQYIKYNNSITTDPNIIFTDDK